MGHLYEHTRSWLVGCYSPQEDVVCPHLLYWIIRVEPVDLSACGLGGRAPFIIGWRLPPEDADLDVRVAVGVPASHRTTNDYGCYVRVHAVSACHMLRQRQ